MGNLKKDCCCLNLKWFIMQSQTYIIDKVKVAWELSNFAAKKGLKHATGVDTSDVTAKKEFVALKAQNRYR